MREDLHATKEGWEMHLPNHHQSPSPIPFTIFNFSHGCVTKNYLSRIAGLISIGNTMTTAIEPYDEAKIISALTDIYQLQQLLCYFPEDGPLRYAPPEGHRIDIAECERRKLSPAVVSLMKRLPYPSDPYTARTFTFLRSSTIPDYTEILDIKCGRDPFNYGMEEDLRENLLEKTELALNFSDDEDGVSMILDTDKSRYMWRNRWPQHC